MNDDFDFEDLDAAVADLLKNSENDDSAEKSREKIVSAEKAEVRENWNLPHENPEKFAENKANNFAKTAPEKPEIRENPQQEISRKPETIAENSPENQSENLPKFPSRGRFMDMVHPSSDAHLTHKINYAAAHKKPENPEKIRENENAKPAKMTNIFAKNLKNPVPENSQNFDSARPFRGEKSETKNETGSKKNPESPFLAGMKIAKKPLSAARPTGENLAEIAKIENKKALENLLESEPEIELSEDDFISKFLSEMKQKPAKKSENIAKKPEAKNVFSRKNPEISDENSRKSVENPQKSAAEKPEKIDHLPRANAKGAPKDDFRAKLDNSMIMPRYHAGETAQIADSPTPFLTGRAELPEKKKHHFGRWIALFLLLLLIGFAVGAWLYLLN